MSAGGDRQRSCDRKRACGFTDVWLAHAQNVAYLLARVTVSHASLQIAIKRDKFVEQSQDTGQDNIISLEATVPAVPGGGSSKLIFEVSKC
jgi:hypothetical protein